MALACFLARRSVIPGHISIYPHLLHVDSPLSFLTAQFLVLFCSSSILDLLMRSYSYTGSHTTATQTAHNLLSPFLYQTLMFLPRSLHVWYLISSWMVAHQVKLVFIPADLAPHYFLFPHHMQPWDKYGQSPVLYHLYCLSFLLMPISFLLQQKDFFISFHTGHPCQLRTPLL